MNETQGSPDMGKTQERVTFFTTNLNYTIQIIPEKKGFDGEVPFILPAKLIKFEGGHYSTDDEETIRLIRNHKRYKKGRITEERKKEILEQKTHRGAITSAILKEEAGVGEKSETQTIQEGSIRVCDFPGCDYAVKDDFSGNKLRMHRLGKHRLGMRPKAPSKKLAGELAEAKKGLKELEVKK
jgi:hypothetical protein